MDQIHQPEDEDWYPIGHILVLILPGHKSQIHWVAARLENPFHFPAGLEPGT